MVYYFYIVRCADGTLYCGITTDISRRLKEHNLSDLGAKYTKMRRPVELVYQIELNDRSEATKEERRIKNLSNEYNLKLIESYNRNN